MKKRGYTGIDIHKNERPEIPGLILWYYFAIKYFWIQIDKMKKNQ